ncbi:MAG: hypothetical protein AB1304_02865 [Bacteroidota bacterium]
MTKKYFKSYSENFLTLLNILFHPIFLPTYFMFWYFYTSSNVYPILLTQFIPASLKIQWLLLYASLTSIMPVVILFLMKIFRVISSLNVNDIKERKYFFLLIGIYYWMLFYMFREIYSRELFKPAILITGVMSVTMFLLSLVTSSSFKISLHSAGYGILTGAFVVFSLLFQHNYLPEIIFCIFLSGLVMEIRLLSNAHLFIELLAGWTIGLLSCISIFLSAYQYFDTL